MFKRNIKFYSAVFFVLALAGCVSSAGKSGSPHWAYTGNEGPQYWGDMSPAYVLAKEGKAQSPINIDTNALAQSGTVKKPLFKLVSEKFELENNGHTIELIPVQKLSAVILDDAQYTVQQFHFHLPAEHTVAGKSFAMELHIVCKDAQENIAVIAVFIIPGNENKALNEVFAHAPSRQSEKIELKTALDMNEFISAATLFYRYDGSLTTPPCTEGVKWCIADKPIQASQAQIDSFTKIYSGNNRPVQNLNGRVVYTAK
ncbi:MAG: carbonic anhydrase family protein [Spirochaetaceae bacterium]|jgi:carbonic anhydrase|nr:carbonic anhydrase family protein [Spirochaetaceae bacterium]